MFTNKTIALLILSLLVSWAVAQNPETTEAADASPVNNADYYYNLGVDAYAQGDPGVATLNFLKALNLNSAHKQARSNLELAIRISPDSALYPQRLFLVRVLTQFGNFLSVNRLAIISLVLLLLTSLSLIWLLFFDHQKELAMPVLTLALFAVLCLCSFIMLGYKSYAQKHNSQAVLMVRTAQLLPVAEDNPKPLMDIHAGLIVTITENKGEDCVVRLPNGATGRLKASTLSRVLEGLK